MAGPAPQQDPEQEPGGGARKPPPVNLSDLAELRNRQSVVRIRAFKNLAANVSNDLPYRYAQLLASYLLLTEWADSELDAVTGALSSLGKCRCLLQALSDVVASGDRLGPQRAVAVVGALIEQPLRFDRDEDWRLGCRKLLLQRALELTGPANNADRAAGILRDLYREQGLAFGLEVPDVEERTELTPVLELLIRHVAAGAARQEPAPADGTVLEQVDRQLRAARFAAENDVEHVVLLQRVWIKVLVVALQGQATQEARTLLMQVPQDLDNKDRLSGNLLEQLRSGEASILRVWALARGLKLK
jgi:hypothetical protein